MSLGTVPEASAVLASITCERCPGGHKGKQKVQKTQKFTIFIFIIEIPKASQENVSLQARLKPQPRPDEGWDVPAATWSQRTLPWF